MGSNPILRSTKKKGKIMRKTLNVIFGYISMGLLGFILFVPCRIYAMGHRVDPSLFGGEILVLFLPFIIMLLVRVSKY